MFRCCVFFFKQKTAYEMRISDWSSDVCSSDLAEMFYRAAERADEVVLLLDEAGTFLKERSSASTSWEQSHTNEFLARMETFPGIRSEERRVGKEGVSTCRYRGSPDP